MYNLAKSRYEAFIVHKIVDAGNLQEGGVNDRLGNGSAQSPFAMRDRPAFCTLAGLWGDQVRPGYCDVTTPSTAIDSGPTATNDTTPTFAFQPTSHLISNAGSTRLPGRLGPQATRWLNRPRECIPSRFRPSTWREIPTRLLLAMLSTIDTTPPETTITSGPILLFGAQRTFTFSSSESGTFECRIDQQGRASCTSPMFRTSRPARTPSRHGRETPRGTFSLLRPPVQALASSRQSDRRADRDKGCASGLNGCFASDVGKTRLGALGLLAVFLFLSQTSGAGGAGVLDREFGIAALFNFPSEVRRRTCRWPQGPSSLEREEEAQAGIVRS